VVDYCKYNSYKKCSDPCCPCKHNRDTHSSNITCDKDRNSSNKEVAHGYYDVIIVCTFSSSSFVAT
jgi:hypothetical protein